MTDIIQIGIVYENATIEQAQLLADCLTDRANVVFLGKERFDWWAQDDRCPTIDADICQKMQMLLNHCSFSGD
jgi:hypothetical protein